MDTKIPGANLTTTTLPVKGLRTKENIPLLVVLRGVEVFDVFWPFGVRWGKIGSGVFLDALNPSETV